MKKLRNVLLGSAIIIGSNFLPKTNTILDYFTQALSPSVAVAETAGRNSLEEKIVELERRISINPYDAEAHYNLGVIYQNTGKIDDAIKEYKEAIRLVPNAYEPHLNLGSSYFMKENYT